MRLLPYMCLICGTALLLSACNGKESDVARLVNSQIEAEGAQGPGREADTSEAVTAAGEEAAVKPPVSAAETTVSVTESPEDDQLPESDVDVDLTRMSSTIVYSEVYNMLAYPERYVGKTVRVSGEYYASYYEETGAYYHYVIIADAAACCEQGMEFIWDEGAHSYPEDYPADFTQVEIVGTFGTYEEEGYEYCYLATDDIVIR